MGSSFDVIFQFSILFLYALYALIKPSPNNVSSFTDTFNMEQYHILKNEIFWQIYYNTTLAVGALLIETDSAGKYRLFLIQFVPHSLFPIQYVIQFVLYTICAY
jgi:hypothetical protein